ncbi:MAG TPA: AtpZ/AtpI family protein [Dehalococcoidia bacterium]|nr:AtpZ/AtpI family protein [Dehalococcoidia bacterium]
MVALFVTIPLLFPGFRIGDPLGGVDVGGWVAPTAYLLGAGWYFATCIVIGIGVGLWVDGLTGLKPTFTLIGIFLGLAVALVGGIRMLAPFMERLGDRGDTE